MTSAKSHILTYFPLIILEFLGKILYFPIWWYSVGFVKKTKSIFSFLRDREKSLGFSVWLKNIFVPMYGQRDFSGRLISFAIRFFQVVFRGFIMLFWIFLSLIVLLLWLVFPIALFLALIIQVF